MAKVQVGYALVLDAEEMMHVRGLLGAQTNAGLEALGLDDEMNTRLYDDIYEALESQAVEV